MSKPLPNYQRSLQTSFTALFYLIGILSFTAVCAFKVNAQTLSQGFSQVLVANGITNPTTMSFAPDGRLFVAQQTGALRVIKNGLLLSKPFIKLTVNSSGERGLLGVAFDPAFSSNKYVYLYYTVSSSSNNRISRFTASGDTVIPGSERVILNLDRLSTATNHNGGTMQFGKDGKLYVGVGDNANSANAQNLDTYHGKILRINSDGSVPTGNPYTSGTAQRQRVWEFGMRNPFTLTIQPVTGRIFVNDVGQNTWEEVNDCTTGGLNYGWPSAEGMSSDSKYTNPVYTYGHGTGIGLGCSIAGGTFFNPTSTNYPSSYIGKYFFLDYCGNWIDVLSLSGTSATRANFASSIAGSPVCMATGPDGNLYFLSRTNSAVYKITYSNSGMPAITNQPQSITVAEGNTASFSVTATGTAPLTYQWRKNGVNISGATNATYEISSVSSANSGNYSVIISNTAGSVTSNNATLNVTAPNIIPIAEIKTPATGATYAGGDVINFSGSGSDSEDGTLTASAFNWYILFHHSTHTHPGPAIPSGVTSGSFTIPNTGETSADVFYRLYLVVTDSKGAKDTTYTDILPRTSVITLNTNPSGLQVTLDGQPFAAPLTFTSVEGVMRTIGVTTTQGNYSFSNWSQGGNATQTLTTPVNDATYTANFTQNQNITLIPLADAFVSNGSYAGRNYGKDTSLIVKGSTVSGYTRTSYLKFSLGSLSNNISSAKLRIYGRNTENTTSISLSSYGVDTDTWTETGITFSNAPAASTTALSSAAVNDQTRYYELDVTNYVKTQYTGDKTVSFLIKNATNQNKKLVFNSRENTLNKPQLVVVSAANRSNNTFSDNNLQIVTADNFAEPLKDVKTPVVYPNPTGKRFNLRFPANYQGRFYLNIINGTGIVYNLGELKIPAGGSTFNIDISKFSLQPGVYFLRINSNERHNQIKLVIQ